MTAPDTGAGGASAEAVAERARGFKALSHDQLAERLARTENALAEQHTRNANLQASFEAECKRAAFELGNAERELKRLRDVNQRVREGVARALASDRVLSRRLELFAGGCELQLGPVREGCVATVRVPSGANVSNLPFFLRMLSQATCEPRVFDETAHTWDILEPTASAAHGANEPSTAEAPSRGLAMLRSHREVT